MRQKITLEKAIAQVHDISSLNYDEMISVKDMRFESLNQMTISGQPFGVAPTAQRLISNRLRVPFSYLDRCPAELQRENLQYWIEQEARNRDALFCRFSGNNVRAIFTERYTAIDNMEVLSKMLDHGFGPQCEVHLSLDPEMMSLKIPEFGRTFKLSENDKVVPGISISNSEVGLLCLTIQAYYYRLVCTNGLISQTSVDARYKHISRRIMDEFHIVLEGVVAQSQHGRNRFMISTQTAVDNPEKTIETFANQFLIPREETEIIKQAYHLEQGGTMFHIINAFTRAAQDRSLNAYGAHRLERAGGNILAMLKA